MLQYTVYSHCGLPLTLMISIHVSVHIFVLADNGLYVTRVDLKYELLHLYKCVVKPISMQ